MAHPPRLDSNLYVGQRCYFVTSCTLDRQEAFRVDNFCSAVRDALFACAAAREFSILAYCLMPDHAHLLLRGRTASATLPRLVHEWKQRTGFMWRLRCGRTLWQKGYWDRILRAEEDILPVARYIIENPVRGGLVSEPSAYLWTGSQEYSVEQILEAAQIDLWKAWR